MSKARLRVFAGPNGSGKSTLFEEFSKKYTENELKIISKMIYIFYDILNSNLELDDSENILNIIDLKLSTLL